jgi:hypothetical protein
MQYFCRYAVQPLAAPQGGEEVAGLYDADPDSFDSWVVDSAEGAATSFVLYYMLEGSRPPLSLIEVISEEWHYHLIEVWIHIETKERSR